MPKTRFGKWSVWLVFAFFLLLATGIFIISRQGPRVDETFFDNPLASIPILGAGVSGILAFFVGTLAIIKNRERSLLVYLTTAVGFFVLIFLLGEILVEH